MAPTTRKSTLCIACLMFILLLQCVIKRSRTYACHDGRDGKSGVVTQMRMKSSPLKFMKTQRAYTWLYSGLSTISRISTLRRWSFHHPYHFLYTVAKSCIKRRGKGLSRGFGRALLLFWWFPRIFGGCLYIRQTYIEAKHKRKEKIIMGRGCTWWVEVLQFVWLG